MVKSRPSHTQHKFQKERRKVVEEEPAETYEEFIGDMASDEASDEVVETEALEISRRKVEKTRRLLEKGKRSGLKYILKLFKKVQMSDLNEFSDEEIRGQVLELALVAAPPMFVKKFKSKSKGQSNWQHLKPVFKNYVASLLHFLKQTKQSALLSQVSKALTALVPVKALFQEYAESIVKATAKSWAAGDKSVTLLCFGLLREFLTGSLIDPLALLRTVYLQFAANSKFTSWTTYERIQLMQQCFVDLLGVHPEASYQVVFIYLRQLSLHLSHSLRHTSVDKVKTVYNWQYLNSFAMLGRGIAQYPSQLGELSNPFVQLGCGLLKIVNIPKYFPYKLHVARVLISLERGANLYIPGLTANLLAILEAPSIYKKSKASQLKTFSFMMAIKASKEQLESDLYKEILVQETCEAILEHLAAVATSIAFVEIGLPFRLSLKRLAKTIKHPGVRGKVVRCVKLIEENVAWVSAQRTELNAAVLDTDSTVSGASPLVAHADKVLKDRHSFISRKLQTFKS